MYRNALIALASLTMLGGCALTEPPPPEPQPVVPVTVETPIIPDSFPGIRFESGSVQLSAPGRDAVREIAEMLKDPSVSDARVRVTGHTDDLGGERSNEEVGMKRAQEVARELVFNGVSPERLVIESLGETQPVAPNTLADGKENPEGRAMNRRVDVVIERE